MSKKQKRVIYLCGPMTGIPLWNFPAFRLAEARLRESGYEVVNPATLHGDLLSLPEETLHSNRHQYLKTDIAALVTRADGLATLPGWGNSEGAKLEVRIAEAVGIPCMTLHDWHREAERTAK